MAVYDGEGIPTTSPEPRSPLSATTWLDLGHRDVSGAIKITPSPEDRALAEQRNAEARAMLGDLPVDLGLDNQQPAADAVAALFSKWALDSPGAVVDPNANQEEAFNPMQSRVAG